MKRNHIILICAGAIALGSCAGKQQPATELPDLAKMLVNQNFKDTPVSTVSQASDTIVASLEGGTVLKFNSDGMWVEMRSADGATVPATVLPPLGQTYLQQIYPGKGVTLLERDITTGLVKATLDDGLELVFDADGRVI